MYTCISVLMILYIPIFQVSEYSKFNIENPVIIYYGMVLDVIFLVNIYSYVNDV